MSKHDPGPTERLLANGATDLERRLLDAAGREQPSQELSERMARAIGISMPVGGAALTRHAAPREASSGAAAPKAATASSSLWPWLAGTIGTAVVVIGVVAATRSKPATTAVPPAVPASAGLTPAATPTTFPESPAPKQAAAASPTADNAVETRRAAPRPSERAATDLSAQLTLVDAAHRALSGGDASGALALARKYSTEYPTGTFRPEASAIRIEALVKLGRTAEARAIADKFATTYGPGPLRDRVAALVGSPQH